MRLLSSAVKRTFGRLKGKKRTPLPELQAAKNGVEITESPLARTSSFDELPAVAGTNGGFPVTSNNNNTCKKATSWTIEAFTPPQQRRSPPAPVRPPPLTAVVAKAGRSFKKSVVLRLSG